MPVIKTYLQIKRILPSSRRFVTSFTFAVCHFTKKPEKAWQGFNKSVSMHKSISKVKRVSSGHTFLVIAFF